MSELRSVIKCNRFAQQGVVSHQFATAAFPTFVVRFARSSEVLGLALDEGYFGSAHDEGIAFSADSLLCHADAPNSSFCSQRLLVFGSFQVVFGLFCTQTEGVRLYSCRLLLVCVNDVFLVGLRPPHFDPKSVRGSSHFRAVSSTLSRSPHLELVRPPLS